MIIQLITSIPMRHALIAILSGIMASLTTHSTRLFLFPLFILLAVVLITCLTSATTHSPKTLTGRRT